MLSRQAFLFILVSTFDNTASRSFTDNKIAQTATQEQKFV